MTISSRVQQQFFTSSSASTAARDEVIRLPLTLLDQIDYWSMASKTSSSTSMVLGLPHQACAAPTASTAPQRRSNLWTAQEHDRFLRGLELFPRGPWKRIAAVVRTKTTRQTMTHAQKYRQKIERHMRLSKTLAGGASSGSAATAANTAAGSASAGSAASVAGRGKPLLQTAPINVGAAHHGSIAPAPTMMMSAELASFVASAKCAELARLTARAKSAELANMVACSAPTKSAELSVFVMGPTSTELASFVACTGFDPVLNALIDSLEPIDNPDAWIMPVCAVDRRELC